MHLLKAILLKKNQPKGSMSDKSLEVHKVIRADIQALRALAIATVVIFHLWPFRLPGGFVGVDVFFVISGFLITTHLLREVHKNSFKISHFWVRRIRRLLPASFTVLATTGIAVVALVPVQLWLQWLREIQASILYFENWTLALDAVDYLALSNEASPTQHFWSLSVEEQFYIVWPILIAIALLFVRKRSLQARKISILAILLFITLSSLAYGIYMTQAEPAIAYFSTPVRAWEFGVGALVAFIPSIKNSLWSAITSISGLLLIAFSSIVFTTALPFPGFWALVPVVGAAAVILGASNTGVLGKFFQLKPFQWLGERSYSIYLWHWPIIILIPFALNAELNTDSKVIALVLTLVLAIFTTAMIEKPFLSGGRVRQFKPVSVFSVLLLVSGILVGSLQFGITQANAIIAAEKQRAEELANGDLDCFGAGARAPGKEPCTDPELTGLYPSLATVADDIFKADNCSTSREDSEPNACELGKRESNIRIALVGDSHAKHYSGAFAGLAEKNNWSVDIFWKGRCPFSFAERVIEDTVVSKSCKQYVEKLEQILLGEKYDLVVTSQANGVEWIPTSGNTQEESAINGLKAIWSSLVAKGVPVLAIKDNPVPVTKAIRCLEMKSQEECSALRNVALKFDPQVDAVKRFQNPLVTLANFDDIYCDETVCFPVIGNVVVYRDANHLTNTFTRTLARFIEPYIQSALTK
jgi:peptidoglycan/LPS O-acetylase OafA/YrhL